jgi:F0F1-type ATP synthase assembly protein I
MKEQLSQKEKKHKSPQKNPEDTGLRAYARYSGLAFQMIIIILGTTWIGTKLDKLFDWGTPVFTIVLSLLGVFTAIYTTLRDFIKK